MNSLKTTIAKLLIAPFIALLSLSGYSITPLSAPTPVQLGSTNAIETPIALFQTSLANSITSSASTMTLVSATTLDGTTLASSTYSFIIDEGTASQEFVKADCTSTACTNMDRGLSSITGTTTVAGLAKSHRRGATVKITDAPILLNLSRIISGIGTFPSLLKYTSGTACSGTSANNTLCDKAYVDGVAISGAPNANETTKGIVELATQIEMASSTALGSTGASVVIQSKYATSSPGTAGLWAVITNNAGKIAQAFLDWTQSIAFSGNNTHSGTESFSGASTFSATSTASANTLGYKIQVSMTASTTITGLTTPQPVYLATSTNAVNLSSANTAAAKDFIGFAVNNATNNTPVLVQTGGVVSGFSGLTPGLPYYVQDSAGTIGSTVGTAELIVGTALSATQLLIQSPTSDQYLANSGSVNFNAIATTTVPLFTRTIIIKYDIDAHVLISGTATLKKTSITSVLLQTCNIGSGACSSNPSSNIVWNPVTSTLVSTPASSPTGNYTAYFYR